MAGLDELDPEHRVRVLAVAAHVAVLAIEAGDGDLRARRSPPTEDRASGRRSPTACCASTTVSAASSSRTSDAAEAERPAARR